MLCNLHSRSASTCSDSNKIYLLLNRSIEIVVGDEDISQFIIDVIDSLKSLSVRKYGTIPHQVHVLIKEGQDILFWTTRKS